jgi:integrase
MSSIVKTAKGWRAQIYVKGERDSQTFDKKGDAVEWAAKRETQLRAVAGGKGGSVFTFEQALDKYAAEVSTERRGERWEVVRLKAYKGKDHNLPIKKKLADVSKTDLIAWRDRRLQVCGVARSTVLRDMTLLSAVFEQARTEWEWIKANPLIDVKKPTKPEHRKRVISPREVGMVLHRLGYAGHKAKVVTVSQAVAHAFLLALLTGMRAGEICGLRWEDVRADYGTAHNVKAIMAGVSRDVPMAPSAMRVIERMRGWDAERVFGVDADTLDALFRRARKRAGLEGFTFHDARHTAATWIAPKLHILDLCKAFGWKRMDQALVYYNPTASQIAQKLA